MHVYVCVCILFVFSKVTYFGIFQIFIYFLNIFFCIFNIQLFPHFYMYVCVHVYLYYLFFKNNRFWYFSNSYLIISLFICIFSTYYFKIFITILYSNLDKVTYIDIIVSYIVFSKEIYFGIFLIFIYFLFFFFVY